MIPRRTFVVFDLCVFVVAFLLTVVITPRVGPLFLPGAPFYLPLSGLLAIPEGEYIGQLPAFSSMLWSGPIIAVVSIAFLDLMRGYARLVDQGVIQIVGKCVLAPFAGLAVMALVLFVLKTPDWSRLFTLLLAVFSAAGLVGYRLLLRSYFRRRQRAGYYAKNVVLVGSPDGIAWMAEYFRDQPQLADEFRLYGYLRVSDESFAMPNLAEIGHAKDLGGLLVSQPIHEVILVHPMRGETWITTVIEECDYLSVSLCIVPEALLHAEPQTLRMLYPLEPLHLPAVMLLPRHMNSDALMVKRLFDIVVSAMLLVLLAPVFAIIAAIIKITTPHLPIFYRWQVVGQNGMPFTGYKFTTMDAPEDPSSNGLENRNEMTGPVFKLKNDPRVTSIGHVLRKYSLNELPQLWSVFKGHMSLVGPRPAFPHELAHYEFWHKRKLTIRPGMTCLWQVSGRNTISNFDDWVKLDLEYIDNWSLWLDVKILARTAWVVVAGTGS